MEDWLALLQRDLSRLGGGPSAGQGLAPGERREVVTLFLDLEGFTSLSESLDHETVHSLVNGIMSVLSRIVETHGGQVDKLEGDRLMALFGARAWSGDDCVRAVECAAAMMSALGEIADTLEPRGIRLGARAGMSCGSVTVAPDASGHLTATGDEVNIASRLEQAAPAGAIMVTAGVRAQTRGLFLWEDRGEIAVRGRSRPVQASVFAGRSPSGQAASGFHDPDLPLSGVDGMLEEVVTFAAGSPDPPLSPSGGARHRVLAVRGGGGAGKTRFLSELAARLRRAGWRVQEAGRQRRGGRSAGWWTAGPGGAGECDAGDLLLTDRLAARDSIRRAAGQGRLALFLDDVHLVDDQERESIEFILSNCTTGEGLLAVFAAPPDMAVPTVHPNYAETVDLPLPALDSSSVRALLASLLGTGGDELPPDLVETICRRAEGNPRFVVELASDLVESGALIRETGSWRLLPGSRGEALPASLASVARVRMDRLAPSHRRALQVASVLGDDFPEELFEGVFSALCPAEEGATAGRLIETGLLAREGGRLRVRDPLMRVVARDSLLRLNRQLVHATAAEVLEGLPATLEGYSVMMATHMCESSRDGAAVWCIEAAGCELCAARPAGAAAWALRAREQASAIEDGPDRDELLVQAGKILSRTVFATGASGEAVEALREAMEAASRTCDGSSRLRIGMALMELMRWKGDLERALELCGTMAVEAEILGSVEHLADMVSFRGSIAMHRGDYSEAAELYERALELARCASPQSTESRRGIVANLASCMLMTDDFERAGPLLEGLAQDDSASPGGDRWSAKILARLGILRGRQDRLEESVRILDEARQAAQENGDRATLSVALGNLGVSALRMGDLELASRSYRHALALSRELGNLRSELMCLFNLANLELGLENLDAAGKLADEALVLMRRSGSRAAEVDITSLLGYLKYRRGDVPAAREALRISEELLEAGLPMGSGRWVMQLRESLGPGAGDAQAQGDSQAGHEGP
jgi:class 3 adenylate cyclase/tetratricopeptide (TPR) repeat protein